MKENDSPLKSIEILEACASAPGGMRMSDLVERTGLSRSTVYRIVNALARTGYLRRSPSGGQRYVVGYRVLPLAASVVDHLEIREVARPTLQELAVRTQESVHLVQRDGLRAYYVDKIDSPQPIGLLSRVGMEVMLHCSGAGKVLLAFASEADRRSLYDSVGLPRRTERTITEVAALEKELALVRDRGYATDSQENREGICCVAGPIFDYRGVVLAAFSVSGPAFRFDESHLPEIIKAVREATRQISGTLGFRDSASA